MGKGETEWIRSGIQEPQGGVQWELEEWGVQREQEEEGKEELESSHLALN